MSQQDSLFQEPGSGSELKAASAGSAAPSSVQSHETDLAAQLKAAQRQVANLFILLLVISGTLTVYLLQQVVYDRANLSMLGAQEQRLAEARQVIDDYNQKSVPAMRDFMKQLGEYSKSHPDILPILAKYGLVSQKPEPTGTAPAQNP